MTNPPPTSRPADRGSPDPASQGPKASTSEKAVSPGLKTQLSDLLATLRLVWISSPGHTAVLATVAEVETPIPVATDSSAAAMTSKQPR